MREIKFRVWTEATKEFLNQQDGWYYNKNGKSNRVDELLFNKLPELFVEQYVGVKDKNGVEICEGDYVQLVEYHMISPNVRPIATWEGVVEYSANDAAYLVRYEEGELTLIMAETTIEVIGNIHEGLNSEKQQS